MGMTEIISTLTGSRLHRISTGVETMNMPVEELDQRLEVAPGISVALECHICLAPPTDPVATACGHLFCWPCLYRWLEGQPRPCPVCRAMVRKDINITPIYGSHDELGHTDLAGDQGAAPSDGVTNIPPRPGVPSPSGFHIFASDQMRTTMDATSEEIISGSFQAVATLMEMNDHSQSARRELNAELEVERARVNVLRRERRHLMASMHYLRRRNFTLIHEAGERARRQSEERQAFFNSLRALLLEDQQGTSDHHAPHHHLL